MLSRSITFGSERRKYARIACCVPATVSGHTTQKAGIETAEIIDYGPDGVCLLLSSKVAKGQNLTVDRSYGQMGMLEMRFEVRWVMASGCRFLVGAKRAILA